MKSVPALIASLFLLSAFGQAQSLPQTPLVSPDVHTDGSVTFRYLDPNAKEVLVELEGGKPAPMQKDEQGVWNFTTAPLPPDYYGYLIRADGVPVIDPRNSLLLPTCCRRKAWCTCRAQLHCHGK